MAPVRVPDRTTRESVMKILVLTGAGISAENGLCAFRDKGGLWSQFDPMKLATPEAFRQRPGAGSRLLQFPPPERPRCAAQPRPFRARPAGRGTRRARRRADARHPEHRRSARARRHQPRHPHARRTPESALRALRGRPSLAAGPGRVGSLPACAQTGHMRPHVVWFGEIPLAMDAIQSRLRSADLFVAIGTSGERL